MGNESTGWRIAAPASLLTVEALLIFVHVRDFYRDSIARAALAFAFCFVIGAYPKLRDMDAPPWRISVSFVAWHLTALAVLWEAAAPALINGLTGIPAFFLVAIWFCAGLLAIASAGLAFIPPVVWLDMLRRTGTTWVYAAAGGLTVWDLAPRLWNAVDQSRGNFATDLTFRLAARLLQLVLRGVTADFSNHILGTGRFAVQIAGACSGVEGLALALIFASLWLWLSRREYRFPAALILIPAAMAAMFALNAIRIAALILIGHAVSPRVAMSGFHSQAGWIAFNLVVLGITVAAPKVPWLSLAARPASVQHNPTVAFLLPFAAILAAGMVSRAASDGFEWLYWVRFFAAGAALWICRRDYRNLAWRPGWFSLFAGISVFLLWIALDRGSHPASGTVQALAALPPPARVAWLLFRALAAVTTVPLAEELAFRGFLLRRIVSAEFAEVDFRRWTYLAVAGSSLAFGLMHGERWIAGTVAGAIYAASMLRRGRIGDAAAAHAVTNALLAVCVLAGGRWYLW